MRRYQRFFIIFACLHALATILVVFEAQQATLRRRARPSAESIAYVERIGYVSGAITFPIPQIAPIVPALAGPLWFAIPGILWATVLVGVRLAWDYGRTTVQRTRN